MAITPKDKQALNDLYKELSPEFKGRKEDYFALLYLEKKFAREPRDVAQQVAFGGNDYGIDAYYIDRESKNLYLYQFKWSEDHNLFKDSIQRLISAGIERIFGNPLQDPEQNQLLLVLKADLHEHQDLIERVYVQFVFKGDSDKAENSAGLQCDRESLEDKAYMIQKYFNKPKAQLIVEFIADKRQASLPPPPDEHEVEFDGIVTTQTSDKDGVNRKILHVGFVRLMDLHRIYKVLGQKFLDKNIRASLSPDKPPNRKIREALKDIVIKQQYPPEVFAFNHNGITLAAANVQKQDKKTIIRVPRLLNGAQTISSLSKFLEDVEGNPILIQNNIILESLRVLAKVVEDDPGSTFVTGVTIANNQQNPVEPWHLRANDRIQCYLQTKFKDELKIFYSRQEKAFENLTDEDLEEMGIEDKKDIEIRKLAQTFLASQGEIDKMSHLRDVFYSQKVYDETFRDSYLNSDARKIVLGYKVGLMLNSAMSSIDLRPSTNNQRDAVHKARNLVWALLVQAFLNDDKLNDRLESFGTSLKKEPDFRDILEKISISKIWPILKTVLLGSTYAEKIEKSELSFLTSKELYRRCMEEAGNRFQWSKKQI